jgi:hypothetical protein
LNIPSTVKIGGIVYDLMFSNTAARDSNSLGSSCANSCEILIDSTAPKQNQESTLIHEIIEQINYRYELNLEHNKITTLETALYQVIKDNPGIFKDGEIYDKGQD